jgi:hypothetical protein
VDLARLCGLSLNNSWAGYVIKQTCPTLKHHSSIPQNKMWKNEIFSSQGSRTRELKLEKEQECQTLQREVGKETLLFSHFTGWKEISSLRYTSPILNLGIGWRSAVNFALPTILLPGIKKTLPI